MDSRETSAVRPDMLTLTPDSPSSPAHVEVSLLQLFVLLAREKKQIGYAVGGGALLALLLAFVIPVRYTAVTSFLPPQQSGSASSAILAQLGSLGSLAGLGGGVAGLKSPNELYVSLLRSETVENAMIARFNLMAEYRDKRLSEARKDFEKRALVDGSGKDGLIRVSVEDHNPARAADLANGYIAEYRRLSAGLAVGEAAQRRAFFEKQLLDAKDKLALAEESLKQTEQTTGVIQMDSQARALIEAAGRLRAEIEEKEVQVQSMRTYSGASNVDLIEAEQQLASMKAQLTRLSGNGSEASSSMMVARGAIPQAGLEYVRKLRDVKYNETIFEILARQFEAAKLDEAKQGALIQVVDVARTPDRKSFPKLSLFLLAGIFLGFCFGCFRVFWHHGVQYLEGIPEYRGHIEELRSALPFARRG
jgi:tyrosine-protein kinase Etk/Wzc